MFSFLVILREGGTLFLDESHFTRINDSSTSDPNTFEQHVLLRTPGVFVQLNTPVELILSLTSTADALDRGAGAVEFATLAWPTGIDVFTLPAGVTVNAPGSYLFNNRFLPPTLTSLTGDFSIIDSPVTNISYPSLTSVGGSVSITDNGTCTSVALGSLTSGR